jgi:hypothetical protein
MAKPRRSGAPDRPSDPPRLRLSGPQQLLAALPYLLGVELRDSVVAVGLVRGPRGADEVGFRLRADLAPLVGGAQPPEELASLAAQHCEEGVILVLYVEGEPSGAGAPCEELADRLVRSFGAERVEVRDALAVQGGRWWSYLCRDAECCPPEGRPVPAAGDSPVPAELTVLGLSPGRPRAELAAELAGPSGLRLVAARQALAAASRGLLDRLAAGEQDSAGWRQESQELLASARDRLNADGPPLGLSECARLLLALDDALVRDEVMGWVPSSGHRRPRREAGPDAASAEALGGEALGGEALWRALLQVAPDECAPAPATLLAWSAYLRGDGLTANLALDRALAADPGYRLALLLAEACAKGVSPQRLDDAVRRGAAAAAAGWRLGGSG